MGIASVCYSSELMEVANIGKGSFLFFFIRIFDSLQLMLIDSFEVSSVGTFLVCSRHKRSKNYCLEYFMRG